jgi:ABC-type spermidine/putrescine transport system permease subunit II
MTWLILAIMCFIWVIIWTIIHINLFRDAVRYRCTVRGLPIITLIIPIIIAAISIVLFFNTLD